LLGASGVFSPKLSGEFLLTIVNGMRKKQTVRRKKVKFRNSTQELTHVDQNQEISVDELMVQDPQTGVGEWLFARSVRECPQLGDQFLERWSAALCVLPNEHAAMQEYDSYWECENAWHDLFRWDTPFSRESHTRLYPLGSSVTPYIRGFLSQELHLYREHVNHVKKVSHDLRRVVSSMAKTAEIWQEAAMRIRFGDVLDTQKEIAKIQSQVGHFQAEYWDRLFCMGEFSIPKQESGVLHYYQALRPLPPSVLLPAIRQERNLDRLFQIRVADLLLEYCNRSNRRSKVSLRTIARLVVLIYICADLVIHSEKGLVIRGSRPARKVSVDATYESLVDAGLSATSPSNPKR